MAGSAPNLNSRKEHQTVETQIIPAPPVPGQMTLEDAPAVGPDVSEMTIYDYQPREKYGSRWLVIPDPEADGTDIWDGILARVDTDDLERALELVGGYPVVAMIGSHSEGPYLAFFRPEAVEQALDDGYSL